jgi:hypothetical protein
MGCAFEPALESSVKNKQIRHTAGGNSYLSAQIGDLEDRQGGEVLGLLAALRGNPDEVTAETVYPYQLVSIHREVFSHFIAKNWSNS